MLLFTLLQLKSPNPDTRLKAAVKLAYSGDPRAIHILIEATRNDDLWIIRKTAVTALGELRDHRAVEPLVDALSDKVAGVQEAAAQALGKIRSPQASFSLRKLLDSRHSWSVRMAAVEALGEIGDPEAIEPLVEIVQSGDSWRLRTTAIEALGKIKDPFAVEPLIAALDDRYASVRIAAVSALAEIGDLRALEPLITQFEHAKLWLLRKAAAEALGTLGDPRAVPSLIKGLRDRWSMVREAAARALGNIGDPRATEALLRVTKDRDSLVRVAAIRALDTVAKSLPESQRHELYKVLTSPEKTNDKDSLFAGALAARALAERATQILERILADRQTTIDPEILRQIAHLGETLPPSNGQAEELDIATLLNRPIDCTVVQKLARQSLSRSGYDD